MMQILLEILRVKRPHVIVLGILLALNVVLLTLGTQYLSPALIDAQAKWNDLRRKVAAAGHADVGTLYKQGKTDLQNLRSRFPQKRQFPRVLGDVLDAAAANGVITGNMSYKPQTLKDENLVSYSISMSVNGNYAALKSFLSDLLKMREMVVVDGFSLNNSDPYEELISMDLRLTVYLREEI